MAKLTVKRFESLDAAIKHYLVEVDRAAGRARADSPEGQSMIYDAKLKEALRYPEGASFPWLESEATELGLPLREVADSIIAARKAWEAKEVKRESIRIGLKSAIRKATTPAEMHRIASDLQHQLAQ